MEDDTDWTMISFETPKKADVASTTSAFKGVCPKCGRELGKGGHFHVKACVGK